MSPKIPRPQATQSISIQLKCNCGPVIVTVSIVNNAVFEVFVRFGKAGGCGSAMADGIATLISYGLRSGLSPEDAVKALFGISCHLGPETCMNVIAKAIRYVLKHLETGTDINDLILEEETAEANAH